MLKQLENNINTLITKINERVFLSLIGAWFSVGIMSKSFASADSMDFFRETDFNLLLFRFVLVSVFFLILFHLNRNLTKLLFLLIVYIYSILSVLCYTGGEGIPNWLFAAVMCIPPLLALIYVRDSLFALLSKFNISKKHIMLFYSIFAVICISFISIITCIRYFTFKTPIYDFGIFAQMFDYMKKTGLPYTTLERNEFLSHFKVHISPILYLILPFYILFPSPYTIQIAQAIAIALGLIPLFLLCKQYNLSNGQTVVTGLLYILYPALSGGAMNDFHENCFLTVCLLFVLYALEKKSLSLLIASTLLVFAIKEDTPIYIACIAIYVILAKKNAKHGGLLALSAVTYFLIAVNLISTNGDTTTQAVRMSNFAYNWNAENDMIQMVKAIIMNPVYFLQECFTDNAFQYLAFMFLPFAGCVLYQKKYAGYLLFGPMLILNLAPSWPYQRNIEYQYNFGNTAIIFYLLVCCLSEYSSKIRHFILSAAVVISSILFLSVMLPGFKLITGYFNEKDTYKSMEIFLNDIDIRFNDSVSASDCIAPHLWRYDWLYGIPNTPTASKNTDYIVVDARFSHTRAAGEKMAAYWGNYTLSDSLPEKIQIYRRTDDMGASQMKNELYHITNILDYLKHLHNTEYTIFISAKDEATQSITPEIMDLLAALGVRSDLQGKLRYCFLAVCNNGFSLYEALEQTRLIYSGNLPDGISFSLDSASLTKGNNSSIQIDGKEYSVNNRGLNFVVFDTQSGKVVDSVCFDTYSGLAASRNWDFLR